MRHIPDNLEYLMKRQAFVLLMALLLSLPFFACAEDEITSLAQLNDRNRRIGTGQGTAAAISIRSEFPLAEIVYYPDHQAGYLAVAQGKIDAYVFDQNQMRIAIEEGFSGVHLLNETLTSTVQIAAGISPVSQIPDLEKKLNRFIGEIRENGTLDDMFRRWVMEDNESMPDIELPDRPSLSLTVGTTGTVHPYSFYKGTELAGYDIELAYRFAAWLGADLQFQVFDYDAIISAAATGKVDCIFANLNVTPERKEALPFSDLLYEEKLGVMVRGEGDAAFSGKTNETGFHSLEGKRIGVQTGTSFDRMVEEKLPGAQVEYYNSKADLVAALTGRKIDAFAVDEPVAQILLRENDLITYLPEYLDNYEFAFVFPMNEAGETLRAQFNSFLEPLAASGKLEELEEKWFGENEGEKIMPDITDLPAKNGKLRVATESGYAPFEYVRDGRVVGYEMELSALFCEASGYGMEIVDMNFDGILPAVQSGKCEFAAAGISITPERAGSVLFADPSFSGGTVMMVLKEETASYGNDIVSSFEKTFIRENRWQLFAEGIGNTLLITVLSILLGTALGFLIFMLCRNGNIIANNVTRFSMWLVQGTPMVVLLMILYYIIFGSVAISGIIVAVIGFTLIFAAAVFGLMRMGVGTIDPGQYEAAYALGHSNRQTFYRIILPQVIPHVLPAYQSEIVGLIKATAVVGYIAVQDLTKMGDIVRSRTYEAFFPLIAITVIYFVLEGLLSFAVSRIRVRIDPKKRKRFRLLKEVNLHD